MNFSGRLMTFTELLANAKLINSFKTGARFTTFLKFTTQKGGKRTDFHKETAPKTQRNNQQTHVIK